jgi:phospholipid/cholesterol/gamma-HCH transport system substrate-binding protein
MRDFFTNRFTSQRTLREGSVGLLFLLGLGTFGIILLWLNRYTAARSTYKAIVEFANAGGMQRGASVRYRGVRVGRISQIQPGPNAVEVEIEIAQADLIIPRDVVIEANQSGLISESIIDIRPKSSLPIGQNLAKPLDQNCNASLIICNNARLKGQIGISLDDLIRSSTELATTYNNPEFYQRINKLLETTSQAATGVAALSQDFRGLTKDFQGQLNTFTTTATTVQRATNQLTASTTKTVDQLGVTAGQFGTTATQASRLLSDLDSLLNINRSTLVGALNNITETSNQLRLTVSNLSPSLNRLTQGELIKNLETLSANAAEASTNLRNATQSLNDPKNAVLLQQTLDSARVTFENTQKITSDLDELTGDPNFRQNLRQLVNGLSNLVSSTDQMEQQAKLATTLESMKAAATKPAAIPTLSANSSTNTVTTVDNQPQLKSIASSQEKLLQQLREYAEKGSGE